MAEAGVKLQEPKEACHAFSQGSWPWFAGPSAVAGCTGCWEVVGRYLPCTQDPWWQWQQPLGSKITATSRARACVGIALPSVSTQREKLLWQGCPSPHAPHNKGLLLLWQAQVFSQTPSRQLWHTSPPRLSSHSQPQSSPRGLTYKAQASAPNSHLSLQVS